MFQTFQNAFNGVQVALNSYKDEQFSARTWIFDGNE